MGVGLWNCRVQQTKVSFSVARGEDGQERSGRKGARESR